MKLGKKPFVEDKRDLLFRTYKTIDLPQIPATFGHQDLISDWGMLGNDTVGDCTCAGADHETMLWTTEGNDPAAFTSENTISDYSAITGYNPDDPDSDRGAVVRQVLLYRQKTGMIDVDSERHQIGAFAKLDHKDINEIKEAMYLFSAIGVGIQLPQSAMLQFNTGKPWKVVQGSQIEGGHYVSCVGYDEEYIYCVTWGQIQKMDYDFFQTYCDEAWVMLSKEFLNEQGNSPEGFNLAQLRADLLALADNVPRIPVLPAPLAPSSPPAPPVFRIIYR
ncbi:MAG: hypothetical protein PHD40_08360 [Syntrophomonadaceae bacterium]|nr:hypothetical protein [Syntrophomonadaceae bacterium]